MTITDMTSGSEPVLLRVTSLRCDYGVAPVGVDDPSPYLNWELGSSRRGDFQTAYQVLAASSAELLALDEGDLWDSGQVTSNESLSVRYAGKPLESAQKIYGKLRVWDKSGGPSPWSHPASWTMGILREADWQGARWIMAREPHPTTRFRQTFKVAPGLRRAIAFVCGLGQYEMTLDGAKVGSDLISPGWTNYKKTCLYDSYDVTPQLVDGGPHAIGLLLGNGMYHVEKTERYTKFINSFGPQKVIAQLRLEYADGSIQFIVTDENWRVSSGPITFSHVFGGEDYDARREDKGWDQANFDESKWRLAATTEGPGGELRGHSFAAPPLRAFDVLKPVFTKKLRPEVIVYDLGQNASLMPRLNVHGRAGSSVKITPAELLHADGSIDRALVGGGEAYWKYTLAGNEHGETYFPRFFYEGCRYLQVELSAAGGKLPQIGSLEGVVVHSSAEPAGEFSCSNELFNRIRSLVRWAQRSNLVSVLTDCPHRERLGWLEQTHLNGPALRSEFRLDRFFNKAVGDMVEAQLPNGLVPDIAPEFVRFEGGFLDSPEWGSAIVLVPWQQYIWTGDTEVLARTYEAMKQYVDYLASRAENCIVSHGLGDWFDIGPQPVGVAQLTPIALTATAFYFEDASVLAQTAQLLGQNDDARHYEELAVKIRKAFNEKFFHAGNYATGSQTANALALDMHLAEPADREAVLCSLIQDVHSHENAVTAGDVGYRYLLRALADAHRSDLIFEMNNQSEKPGYGMMLARGATALTEAWDQVGRPGGSSQNHFMLGQITEWLYGALAGIAPDPAGPGFRRVLIRPQPTGDVVWAKGRQHSVRGVISTEWRRAGEEFHLNIALPPGCIATVFLPARDSHMVTEGGTEITPASEVKFLRRERNLAVLEVGSGLYQFSTVWP